ncbi:MAG TPA: hypothetical protein PK629_09020 [Oscillospiraceae bacterium]|nr:hypothetical protein [Oscillospiraceae bacterium]HPF56617.1 hypothetical protein [Clostridiales bacterium]HPK36512.1 hypothetical protein [Oscillospiraceae bacterium]HPR75745.1 hypothetical protein [Oscillospiraceae bacterium]
MKLFKVDLIRNIAVPDEKAREVLLGGEIPCCQVFHEWLTYRQLL